MVPRSGKFLLFEHAPQRTEWGEGWLAASKAHSVHPQTCKEIRDVLGSVLDRGACTERSTPWNESGGPANEDSPLEDFYTFSSSVSFSFVMCDEDHTAQRKSRDPSHESHFTLMRVRPREIRTNAPIRVA